MNKYLNLLKSLLFGSFAIDLVLERIDAMRSLNYFDEKYIAVASDKRLLVQKVESYISGIREVLSHEGIGSDVALKITSTLCLYKKEILNNRSFDLSSAGSMSEAFNEIVKDIRNKNIDDAIGKIILFIQLYGSSRENPLICMKNYKLVNGAWKNGSIEGYPVILLLDTLKRTSIISRRKHSSVFEKTCTHQMRLADFSYTMLRNGNYDAAKRSFYFLLNDIYKDPTIKEVWEDTYQTIISFFCSKDHLVNYKNQGSKLESASGIKKIIVSGMGWSGSGAVYAYLKEFASIQPIKSEIQYITGVSSTRTLRGASGDIALFRNELLKFFGIGLFGYAGYSNYQEYRTLIHANQFTLSEQSLRYSQGIQEFCTRIIAAYKGNEFDIPEYIDAIDNLLVSVAETVAPVEGKTLLFDNIIKMHQLKEIDYINNGSLIYVFRDPRSNYVALCRESVKFNPSVHAYIRFYKSRRIAAENEYQKVINKEKVMPVQFEEFVLSEDYRKKVASWLGLDFSRQDVHSSFQPWISQKNVLNYEDFEDKKSIMTIENELPEYLWEGKRNGTE